MFTAFCIGFTIFVLICFAEIASCAIGGFGLCMFVDICVFVAMVRSYRKKHKE